MLAMKALEPTTDTTADPCLSMAEALRRRKRWGFFHHLVGGPLMLFGLHTRTDPARVIAAVRKELVDLDERALAALDRFAGPEVQRARAALEQARAAGRFPRGELLRLSEEAGGDLRDELHVWVGKHQALEKRLGWLLDTRGTRRRLPQLDARADCDEIWCWARYAFRPEHVWGLWGNAIERIAQIESAGTFFHGTGEAELDAVKRTEDTAIFYATWFNWGKDSYHGRKAIEGMNRIHGRYFIHNDGMKYVLLNAAFTILDGLDRIGHRKLTDKERLGYFHAQVELGQAMNIQGLTHDWDEMYGWFHGLNKLFSAFTPQKRRMYFSIEDGFDREVGTPKLLVRLRRMIAFAGMDDTYRSALGVRTARWKGAVARGLMFVIAFLRTLLPEEPDCQSLTSYITYRSGPKIEELGVRARSSRMPGVCPFSGAARPAGDGSNRGYPENQRPLLSAADARAMELPTVGWDEVRKHNVADDLWVVWGGHVYDVTAFARNHPGGLEILLKGNPRDMTRAFEKAKHTDLTKIFALNFRVAKIAGPPPGKQETSPAAV